MSLTLQAVCADAGINYKSFCDKFSFSTSQRKNMTIAEFQAHTERRYVANLIVGDGETSTILKACATPTSVVASSHANSPRRQSASVLSLLEKAQNFTKSHSAQCDDDAGDWVDSSTIPKSGGCSVDFKLEAAVQVVAQDTQLFRSLDQMRTSHAAEIAQMTADHVTEIARLTEEITQVHINRDSRERVMGEDLASVSRELFETKKYLAYVIDSNTSATQNEQMIRDMFKMVHKNLSDVENSILHFA